ncbi:MAG: DUF4190 domain-containing protein [Candidatus Sumerlaeota bacterium]|nr:DUF4190 domain-containing protein [Candidatus Sumerlaeota bacterium]
MNCPRCNAPMIEGALFCSQCGFSQSHVFPAPALPVSQTSGMAIASFVLGLLSFTGFLCCFGWPLGALAIVLGVVAVTQIGQSLNRLTGKGFAIAGIVLGALSYLAYIPFLLVMILPNFFVANTAAKGARAQADLRVLSVALEAYYVDANAYPDRLSQLTTPVAYMNSLQKDPFDSGAGMSNAYSYSSVMIGGKSFWVVWSPGPDNQPNLRPQDVAGYSATEKSLKNQLLKRSYDPTNGTRSPGDIIRTNLGDLPESPFPSTPSRSRP